jgi:hypothetical protein
MRFFFIGPRILGIRPGISFGAETGPNASTTRYGWSLLRLAVRERLVLPALVPS